MSDDRLPKKVLHCVPSRRINRVDPEDYGKEMYLRGWVKAICNVVIGATDVSGVQDATDCRIQIKINLRFFPPSCDFLLYLIK